MTDPQDPLAVAWWAAKLDDLDHEIARLAQLCQVRILDPGVIERVLRKDASVCGTANPVAFAKLHNMVMMHLAVREKSAAALGQQQTVGIEAYVIERLKKSFPDLGSWQLA